MRPKNREYWTSIREQRDGAKAEGLYWAILLLLTLATGSALIFLESSVAFLVAFAVTFAFFARGQCLVFWCLRWIAPTSD